MIASLLHLVVAGILAGLTVIGFRTWRVHRRSYTLIVLVVGVGLTYDNAVLGVGRWLGHGSTLEALSYPRFVIHALATPLLVIVGFGAARALGVRFAQSRAAHAIACTFATALVGWGIVTDIVRLELEAQTDGGMFSYGNALGALPVPAIATIVVLLGLGIAAWRAGRWPWLAVGAAVMFVASGLGAISGLLTNVGELTLLASLVATERKAGRRSPGRPAGVSGQATAWSGSPVTGASRSSSGTPRTAR